MTSTQAIQPPSTPLGLLPTGLSVWRQTDWQQSLEAAFQASFGVNTQLDAQSINGQLINIFAERMALLTELLESIYNAQYPNGAEGVAVDNQLAIVGLVRKPATATVTAPNSVTKSNGITLYGLVLYGTPGTVVPAGTLLADSASPPNTYALDADVTIGAAQNAAQALALSASPTAGSFSLTAQLDGATPLTTAQIDYRALPKQTQLIFPASDDYTYTLSANGQTTGQIMAGADPSTVATALNNALGLTTITAGTGALGTVINWPVGPIPIVTAQGQGAPSVIDAIQASLNGLQSGSAQPFSDVAVTGGGQSYAINFGANTPLGGNPSTAAMAIPLVTVASNTLTAGQSAVNLSVRQIAQGQAALGIGSATCTQTGPIAVAAGALSSIQTPLQGLSSVTNQLACITGRSVETDSEALQRRATQLSASAEGPTAAVLQRVQNLSGVTTALAFVNDTNAAQQLLVFATVPTTGSYQLVFATGTTATLAYSASASAIQSAVRAIPELETVVVTGSLAYGFRIDFAGAMGGQAQPLTQVIANTTDAAAQVYFGRYPHAIELVVQGGSATDIAQEIYQAAPAGLGSYGAAVSRPNITTTAGSPSVTVSTAQGLVAGQTLTSPPLPLGATIVALSGNQVTLSAAALSTATAVPAVATYAPVILDSNGNQLEVHFSRPQPVNIYASVVITSDQFLSPGIPSSGVNPNAKWSPASIATIQSDVINCLSAVPIGGTVLGLGTNGVRACLSQVPGMIEYDVYFDLHASPTNTAPIALLENQVLALDPFNVTVSWT